MPRPRSDLFRCGDSECARDIVAAVSNPSAAGERFGHTRSDSGENFCGRLIDRREQGVAAVTQNGRSARCWPGDAPCARRRRRRAIEGTTGDMGFDLPVDMNAWRGGE
ncbi:MAG: hypothetical protein U1E25_14975 [Methylocystis sp.]